MKSTSKQLHQRGMINEETLKELESCLKEDLINGLSASPQQRTACIHLLSTKYHDEPDYTYIMLNQLMKEKALYTKIEIQNNLTLYGNIKQMCEYLGKIGTNQHKVIPSHTSLKRSYPLPRDIIARSLCHIDTTRFSEFFCALTHLSESQLCEAIDALGYICFYHPEVIDEDIYCFLNQCLDKYQSNELMIWKIVTCLSAFPQSIDILYSIKDKYKHPTIREEVERSLKLIHQPYSH